MIPTPMQMQQYERILKEEVSNCFPGARIQVTYAGTQHGHKWCVTVNGINRTIGQQEAELATGFRRDDFRALFNH
jgi:hypothetical protein